MVRFKKNAEALPTTLVRRLSLNVESLGSAYDFNWCIHILVNLPSLTSEPSETVVLTINPNATVILSGDSVFKRLF